MNTKHFAEIIGHHQIRQALQRAMENGRVAHAYLFSGAEAIGKYKTALAFARMLQCTCGTDSGARCLACAWREGQAHPDITTVIPQGATIRLEQIREIQKDLPYQPRVGKWKIYIFDGVERLTEQAANSLLKMLEEPPAYVVFILLTVNIYSVLPTILSRCQHLSFQAVPADEIAVYLREHGCQEEQAAVIAAVSGGIPGRALLWAESGYQLRDQVIQCLEDLKYAPAGKVWDTVAVFNQERAQILITLELISYAVRDCLVWKTTGNRELLLYKDCTERIAALTDKAALEGLLALYKELTAARPMILGNANSRLLWEKICLRIQDVWAEQKESG